MDKGKPVKTSFSVNVNLELLVKIGELAKKEHRSRNNMINQLLKKAMGEADGQAG